MTGIINLEIPPEFIAHCTAHGLTPVQVLCAFMADLAETAESNGSDERQRAEAWFDRVIWPTPPDRRLRIYRAPSGEWSGVMIEDDQEIGRIAGCISPDEVEDAAYEQGWEGYEVDVQTPSPGI